MSEKGQGASSTPLGAAAGAAGGAAAGAAASAAGGEGSQANQAGPLEYGQGLQGFQPEANLSDLIVDANSQTVDADPVGGSTPPDFGGSGNKPYETK